MNLHEKVERQYKVVEIINMKDDESKMFLTALEELIAEYKKGGCDPALIVEEMKETFEEFYVTEYEMNVLKKAFSHLWGKE